MARSSRRRLLTIAGGVACITLAGCSDEPADMDDDDSNDDDQTNTESDETDENSESRDNETDEDEEPVPADLTAEDLVEIELRDSYEDDGAFAFDPDYAMITAGTTVQWANTRDVFHTVTSTESLEEKTPSGEFDGTVSEEGDTVEYEFEENGTYQYYCQPHAGFMDGIIEVV